MKGCRSGWWLAVVMGAFASGGSGASGASAPAPASRPSGERIDFTVPREVVPVRPPQGMDLQGRSFNSTPRDTPSDGVNMVTSMPLPAPSDVNRLRLLQELLGRRGQLGGSDPASPDQIPGMKLDDPMEVQGAGTQFNIDDLFDRQRGRLGSENREGGDNRRPGSGRDDRSGRDRDRDRDRDRGRDSERDRAFDADGRMEPGQDVDNRGLGAADAQGKKLDSGQSHQFLPDLRAREDEFRNSLMGNRREADERTDAGGDRMATGLGLGSRDSDDPIRSRQERMEAFRRILGGGTTVDSWLSAGTRATLAGDAKAMPGGVGAPGAATSGARTLGSALDARGGAVGGGATGGAEAAQDRTFAMPSRPLELNLGAGRGAVGGADAAPVALSPALRPMELFQRKHDTRLPTRGF